MSLAAATALGEPGAVAPSLSNWAYFDGVRFQTATGNPARSKLRTIGVPIMPVPKKPILSII
jgi:hypothetical protein